MRRRLMLTIIPFVLCLLAGGAHGAIDHSKARPDLYPWDRLDSLQDDFAEHSRSIDRGLAALAKRRGGFNAAADKSAWLREHEGLLQELSADFAEAEEVRGEIRRVRQGIQFTALARGFQLKDKLKGHKNLGPVTSHIIMYERMGEERRDRFFEQIADFKREQEAFGALKAAHEAGQKKRRKHLLIAVAAGIAVVLGAASFLLGRGGREPEIMPVALGTSPVTMPGQPAPITAAATGPAPQLPAVIGDNFEIIRQIGQGGMGQVFEAQDRSLGRRVAVKQMRPELLQSTKELEQFLTEARLVASLKHPNLVEIHSIVKEVGQIFLVFEYIDGRTLQGVIEARDRLPWKEATYVLKCAASALDYAHAKKVVHRDLKPANIMISREGVVKVMDFGIAYQAKSTIARLTRADAWGTPPYMAPEQEMGGVSSGVDIYALAICFYQMLTGELPFTGPNFLAQKREEFYTPPRMRAADLPAGIDEVFKRALAAEAGKRFATGAELVAAVARL
ncbi:MAG: protein kinase [Elusimicrobiota bacterium]